MEPIVSNEELMAKFEELLTIRYADGYHVPENNKFCFQCIGWKTPTPRIIATLENDGENIILFIFDKNGPRFPALVPDNIVINDVLIFLIMSAGEKMSKGQELPRFPTNGFLGTPVTHFLKTRTDF